MKTIVATVCVSVLICIFCFQSAGRTRERRKPVRGTSAGHHHVVVKLGAPPSAELSTSACRTGSETVARLGGQDSSLLLSGSSSTLGLINPFNSAREALPQQTAYVLILQKCDDSQSFNDGSVSLCAEGSPDGACTGFSPGECDEDDGSIYGGTQVTVYVSGTIDGACQDFDGSYGQETYQYMGYPGGSTEGTSATFTMPNSNSSVIATYACVVTPF